MAVGGQLMEAQPVMGQLPGQYDTSACPPEDTTKDDGDLTNLTWLQNSNLLRTIPMAGGLPEEVEGAPTRPHPYDPKIHKKSKPPYSFTNLIFMAIEESEEKALPVRDIYRWITSRFHYYLKAPDGWKNSVRHNLSLNKCFHKMEAKGPKSGKGGLWYIQANLREGLLNGLRKYPKLSYNSPLNRFLGGNGCYAERRRPSTPNIQSTAVRNTLSPELFPLLSKKLESAASSMPVELDAANIMLSLHNQVIFKKESEENEPPTNKSVLNGYHSASEVITNSPSEDHTYSASQIPPPPDKLENDAK